MPGGQADFRLDTIAQKGSHLQIIGTSLSQQVIADFTRQLEFSNGLFSGLMLSIEGKEVKLDDLSDRADKSEKKDDKSEKKDTDKGKKDTDKKDSAAKDADKAAAEVTRVFQFTIDCDYNKPRAEGEKPASAPQGK
jgi:hypothetical protein